MMLIITSPNPQLACDWLVENTNKNFCFKQLLELGQLICSAGISDVYKPIKQGKELQEFCKEHIEWIYYYYENLYVWCKNNVKLQARTKTRLSEIRVDIFLKCDIYKKKQKVINSGHRFGFEIELAPIRYDLTTAIWRYSKEYESEYPTNSELPIDAAVEEYRKYIENYKFKKN